MTLTANANPGYEFNQWIGDASGTENTVVVTMDGNKSVTAIVVAICSLTPGVIIEPAEQGIVGITPNRPTYCPGLTRKVHLDKTICLC